MRIEVLDRRREALRVTPESEEDLWVLKTVVRPGDLVKGRTFRDVAVGGRGEKEKRPITVKIRVKNVEFQPFTGRLRFFGVIVEGPEEYGVKGKHQSILVTPGTTVILERPGGWPERVLKRLESTGPRGSAVVAAIDYDEYGIAVVSPQGMKILVDKYVRLPGKDDPSREHEEERLIAEAASSIVEAAAKYRARVAVVAGPGPLKQRVADRVRASAPGIHVIVDDASMGGRAGIEEALRRQSVARALKDYTIAEAEALLAELMKRASRDPSLIAVGVDEVLAVSRMGAAEAVVVTDDTLFALDDEVREKAVRAVEEADKRGARVVIVPQQSPPGERLRLMGGIAAVLRFPVPPEARRLEGGTD